MIAQSRRCSTLVFSSVALTLILYGCELMAPLRPLPPLPQPSPPPSETLSQAPVTPPPSPPPPSPPPAAPPPVSPAPPPAPVPVLPFDEAMLVAANNLFTNAKLRADAPQPSPLLIDPLIDGSSGEQSSLTRTLGARIVDLVRAKYPRFDVRPFSAAGIAKAPIVLIGTFTGVNHEGKTAGVREAYRICLALADLKSGLIIAKGTARAQMQGIDVTPTAYFRDSPTWRMEPSTEGYIKTCQGTKIGDPINPAYLDGILSAALIGEAIEAYDAGRYRDALELYENAVRSGASDVLRAQNGIYLSNWKLGRRQAAMETFGQIVDHGLASQRLTVKFLFRPGSTAFVPTPSISEPYPLWLKEIARRSVNTSACLEITGHTSPTGPEPLNERLSLLRAETIKQRLETEAPPLARRSIANGVGSRENLIGTGRDDVTDALDRRVVFKVIGC